MATRTRATDEARRLWLRTATLIGDELRAARLIAGLTQAQVAAALGISQAEVSRRERGRAPRLRGVDLAVHAAVIGLKLWVRLFNVGAAVRDDAQARYIAAFLSRIGEAWRVILEAVVPIPGDLRAADILLISGHLRIVVEVITRLADAQAQIRAAQLKARDLDATRLVIVLAATHANRDALNSVRDALGRAFSLDTRGVMAALAAGRDPGRDAIVLLTA
jgi:transcriptional regulator with XRE-family HTH domain